MTQIRPIPLTPLIISALSLVFWGIGVASIWVNVDPRVMPVDWAAAVMTGVFAAIGWTAAWLRNRDMASLIDVVVTQHARALSRTIPLRRH